MRIRALAADAAVAAILLAGTQTFGCLLVTGDSMRPALEQGDLALFTRGARVVAPGSVVVLGAPGHSYVHRVVSLTTTGAVVTRGDANPIADREPTTTAAVRGRVCARIPSGALLRGLASSGGRVRLWSQSHTQR